MLAKLNELGFITESSQPGEPVNAEGTGQRAYVDGLCDVEVADRVRRGLGSSELVAIVFPPATSSRGRIVVSLEDGDECTWCGIQDVVGYEHVYAAVSPDLEWLVANAWRLQVIDPVWGRDDVLWSQLLTVLQGANQ